MTQKVSDEQYGRIWKKVQDLVRRISQGTLPFDLTMDLLQEISEGKKMPKYPVKYYYPIPVDPTMSLTALLRSAGYDENMVAGSDIFTNKNFPSRKAEPREIKFAIAELPNHYYASHVSILADMSLRPASLRETIAFQAKFPEAQGQRDLNVIDAYEREDRKNSYHFCNACFDSRANGFRSLMLREASSRNINELTVLVAAVSE